VLRPISRRRSLAALVTLSALALSATPAAAAAGPVTSKVRCTGDPATVKRLDVAVAGEQAWGLYALPSSRPKGLVVFFHGYTHTAHSWAEHIRRTAAQDGVIAVAMNYRGQIDLPPYPGTTLPRSRGWQVSEGAADSIAAAKLFDRTCPGLPSLVAYGVSMGGNASGLAVAARATRASGAPLFDQWFDIEGAVNVIEIYTGARALAATGNTLAAQATEDIERQMGGTIEQQPEAYTTRTVVRRAEDIKASGVMGVTLVHGADDGLVPYSQSREMQSRLLALGIPTDMITVGTRGESSEPGTTLTGSLGAPGYESPFAGHADEASTTHIVGNTGFERLAAYFGSGETPRCREFVVDGATRTMTQVPGTGGC
jgi:acetyl esterase/lipase